MIASARGNSNYTAANMYASTRTVHFFSHVRYVSSLPCRLGGNKKHVRKRRAGWRDEEGKGRRREEGMGRKIQMKFRASVYGHARFSGWLDGGEKDATTRSGDAFILHGS